METTAGRDQTGPDWGDRALQAAAASLVTAVWISAGIFGLYILAYFGGAVGDGELERWNVTLRLYNPDSLAATAGIGLHFAAGAVLLIAGPIQLIGAVRERFPAFHRWTGRIYVASAILAGAGGLTHIAFDRTIGGPVMDVGFAIYGVLMVVCGVETLRHAMVRRIDVHRAWAIRLFALAIGSWLYRVEYGLWEVFTGSIGHTRTFDGWFDYIMDFFFFVPNLIIAELFIRARGPGGGALLKTGASLLTLGAAGLIALSTYFFTRYAWGPPIAALFAG
jgi:hypothetical protein